MSFINRIIHLLESLTQVIHLHVIRIIDHAVREITGQPTLTTSMVIPNLFLGGQYGVRGAHLLRKAGITAVISMRRDLPFDPQKFGFQSLHLPTPDQHPPTLQSLKKGIIFINDEIDRNGKVYVHCRWGEGRGPSMAAAYLISTGLTTDDALALIKKVRIFIQPTKEQVERLRELEHVILKQRGMD